MRHLGLVAVLLGACIPEEPDWLVTEARFRGVQLEVVEAGGYSSLLNVPPGRRRAAALPLDTIELEWKVALPPGAELQPPLWIACEILCAETHNGRYSPLIIEELRECPRPLPLSRGEPCLLGEGHRLRVGLGSAFTLNPKLPYIPLLVVGSRRPDVAPATCVERLRTRPLPPVEACIFGLAMAPLGPSWAALPFDPESAETPPELLAQEPDTHPELVAFAVTRRRGGETSALLAAPGDAVPVRRGERITVTPRFAEGSAQEYWSLASGDPNTSSPSALELRTETLGWQAHLNEWVDDYDEPKLGSTLVSPSWTVPHDVVPTTLYIDVSDNRSGRAFGELHFVPDPAR
jgi:hypothetical protein